MNENLWWRRYRQTLESLPYTGDDADELYDVLRIAGYFNSRSGLPRPSALDPERAATAAWRLRYLAPESARRTARKARQAEPVHVTDLGLPDPWWFDEDDPEFWFEVERQYSNLQPGGSREGHAELLRSATGRQVLTGLQRARGGACWNDPQALAHAATTLTRR
jgi:hypothetical protein